MNRSNIEWCDYTWNPIVGCRIGCHYCWARRMNARVYPGSDFTDPTFFPTRLQEPRKLRKPSKIFVCSMADIFSPGITDDWVGQVIDTAASNPIHTFQFLTKRPEKYRLYNFPPNVWLGATVTRAADQPRIDALRQCGCKYTRFVVVEPLMGDMTGVDFTDIDLVFVGAMTGPRAMRPDLAWIESIKHPNIVWKENIRPYLNGR